MDEDAEGSHRRGQVESPLLVLVNVLFRQRRALALAGLIGGSVGAVAGLLAVRTYESRATLIPNSAAQGLSGLALAASQFGVDVPIPTGGAWGTSLYVSLLQSPTLLDSVVSAPFAVAEENGRSATLAELLRVTSPNPARLRSLTIDAARRLAFVRENRLTGAVEIVVTTRWPSVSQGIADRMIDRVHQYNLQKLRATAAAERVFVEGRAALEADSLRAAEMRLQAFQQANRALTNSPELAFRRERLQRDVQLHEVLYTNLLRGLDEARIREVRNTPVITVVEEPRLAAIPRSRRVALKTALGLMSGFLLVLVLGVARQAVLAARASSSGPMREFAGHLDAVMPAAVHRWIAKG